MAGAAHESAGVLARLLSGVLGLWACAAAAPAHGVDVYSESAVRAAFVMRFANYVEWPPDALATDRFQIAVLGDASLAGHIEELATGRALSGRAVHVHRISAVSQLRDAQVLVVGAARRGELRGMLRDLAGRPVLVITAEEGALAAGSVINFQRDQGRVRFEISVPAAQRRGLRISSELLSVAARVQQ